MKLKPKLQKKKQCFFYNTQAITNSHIISQKCDVFQFQTIMSPFPFSSAFPRFTVLSIAVIFLRKKTLFVAFVLSMGMKLTSILEKEKKSTWWILMKSFLVAWMHSFLIEWVKTSLFRINLNNFKQTIYPSFVSKTYWNLNIKCKWSEWVNERYKMAKRNIHCTILYYV